MSGVVFEFVDIYVGNCGPRYFSLLLSNRIINPFPTVLFSACPSMLCFVFPKMYVGWLLLASL